MSRQNYYKQRSQRKRKEVDEKWVVSLVREQRQWHPLMGGRKLLHRLRGDLAEAGFEMGRDRFFEILGRHDLLIERGSGRVSTTRSRHRFRKYPNLLKEREITGPHEAWVSDLTYIRSREGFLYLSLVTDDFSRKIVGHQASDGLEAEGCLRALSEAIEQLPRGCKPTHHSDRGTQYCCKAYTQRLQAHDIEISMTEENHCYENAKAERVIGILKQEYGLGRTFRDKPQAREAIEEAIWLYNEDRPHQSLGYATPARVHRQAA